MSGNALHEFKKIDYNLIEQWNLNHALDSLFSCFNDERNSEGGGLYKYVDEKDVFEIIYLILKHSKGTIIPKDKDITSLASKLTVRKISDNSRVTQFYALFNGEMPDFHLFYFLDRLFTPYMEKLNDEQGFNHHVIRHIHFFIIWHPSFVFTLNDIAKMVDKFFAPSDVAFEKITNFVKLFSDEPCLESFESFQKSVSKKPIIKLSGDKYLLCWHWLRTSILFNLHYLLASDEKYKKHRGDVFEEITASLFNHHLKSGSVYTGVLYDGGEIDVIVDTNDTILLIECKSGILYEDYKLGMFDDKVKDNIESITGKARKQLHNAKNAILRQKDIRSNGVKLKLNANKNIMLLNVCFEFPVGITNKDTDEDVIVLSLVDLMMVIDLMEEQLLGKPRIKNLLDYLDLRKKTLGFATDDELTIAISLLYNPHIETIINTGMLGHTYMNSNKSIRDVNYYWACLLEAKILQKGEKYKYVKKNYKGFFRNYIVEN